MKIQIKRIYDSIEPSDGTRILVDRLWPRGFKKETAGFVFWAKETAPSNELRKWYSHDHEKWNEFKAKYFTELDKNPESLDELRNHLKGDVVTFVFSSKEARLNNANALKEYIETHLA